MDKQLNKNESSNSSPRRSNLLPNIFYQNDRVFSEKGGWYFRTKELEEIGPFESREEAKESLEMFVLLNADSAPVRPKPRVHH